MPGNQLVAALSSSDVNFRNINLTRLRAEGSQVGRVATLPTMINTLLAIAAGPQRDLLHANLVLE